MTEDAGRIAEDLTEAMIRASGAGQAADFDLGSVDEILQVCVMRLVTEALTWGIPSSPALDAVARYAGKLLELGAGSGLWSRTLAARGLDAVAVDSGGRNKPRRQVFDVIPEDAVEAVSAYPDRDVLIVWPDYGSRWPARIAQLMAPGRILFYQGEYEEGCCADDEFFRLVASWEVVDRVEVPTWSCLHDDWLTVWRKT